MAMQLATDQVWSAINKEMFAVLGMVTPRQQSRTVGIVYIVRDRKLYIGTGRESWKARHIAANRHVSITIPIAKRIPLLPWIKIPAATIAFSGTAQVQEPAEVDLGILQAVFRDVSADPQRMADSCLIAITPEKEFITYGIGIPLMEMRHPEKARGRAPVNG